MTIRFARLTRLACRNLQPGQSLSEHGISFERLVTGDGRYTVNVMVDGIRVHRVIGKESDGVTRQQCEDFIERARTDARQGRLNLPKRRKVVLGFAEAAREYLEKLGEEGGKDLKMKVYRLSRHLVPFFRDKPLSKLTTLDVQRYKKARLEAGAAPGSVNRELAALSHLFSKAIEWHWLEHKPALIKRLKEDKGRITYLVTEQAARLLDAARQDQCWSVYPFIVIGLETAMRRMEILSIRLEHIDLENRSFIFRKPRPGPGNSP